MKLLKSNWRELVAIVAFLLALLFGIWSLGTREVAQNSAASAAVSVAVQLLGGVAKFVLCLALAWVGAAITFPEANRFIVSTRFDSWWEHQTNEGKARVSLVAVAVLAIVAALCIASA